MDYFLIKGTFDLVKSTPDGDTGKLIADNMANWKKIDGYEKMKMSKEKHKATLRFDAIDTLELHYPSPNKKQKLHQPLKFANQARDLHISNLGIKNVKWKPDVIWAKEQKIIESDITRGYILANAIDHPLYGRVVSFLFPGETSAEDGTKIALTPEKVKESINYKLVQAGLAHPTYYKTLPTNLRNVFSKAVQKTRKDKRGLWDEDKTNKGLIFKDLQGLYDNDIILPKFFRRFVEHMWTGGTLDTFKEFLKNRKDKDIITTTKSKKEKLLSDIIEIDGDNVKLTEKPENIIFKK